MSENSSIKCLRVLSGVFIDVEDAIKSAVTSPGLFKQDAFKLAETLLNEGGVPVLPSHEEFRLTPGGGLLKIRVGIDRKASSNLIAVVVYTTLHQSIKIEELNELTWAVTWSQIQCGLTTANEFGKFISGALHAQMGLLSKNYKQAHEKP